MDDTYGDLSGKIKSLIHEIKDDRICIGNSDSDSDLSDNMDIDDLSMVSDVSSVGSFAFSPLKPNEYSFSSNNSRGVKKQKKQSIPKQSRIPVPKAKRTEKPKTTIGYKLAKPIPIQTFEIQPTNFLAPDLSDYAYVCVCIFEGTDFPKSRFGERSTYVSVKLHPDLQTIESPKCYNRTVNAVYNGGWNIPCAGIDFSSVVPMVEVYDFISEERNEILGIAYIPLHMTRKVNDYCVVYQNEWIDIYTINSRVKSGKVKMSLIFHNETDITQFIEQNEIVQQQHIITQKKIAAKPDNDKPVLESMAVQTVEEPKPENKTLMDNCSDLNYSMNFTNSRIVPNAVPTMKFNDFDSPSPEKTRKNPFNFGPVRRVPIDIPPLKEENEEIPQNIPVKPTEKKKEIVFVDENDLSSLSDEFMPHSTTYSLNSFSRENTPQSSNIAKKEATKPPKTRIPLQPQPQNIIAPAEVQVVKTYNDNKGNRYTKYSDFSWDKPK